MSERTAISGLKAEQQSALEMLGLGKSMAETARVAGIARVTIYRWLKHDPAFAAAYNQWKEEVKESCRGRVLAMTDKATEALEGALERGDAKLALALLKGLGLVERQKEEVTEMEEIAARVRIFGKKRKRKLEASERQVDLDDQYSRLAHVELEKTVKEWGKDEEGVLKNKSVKWKE